jgi:hypothetical protein
MKKSAVAILVQKLIPDFKAPLRPSTSGLTVSMAFRGKLGALAKPKIKRLTVDRLEQEKSPGSGYAFTSD